MLWGQQIKVYTHRKNLIRNALGLTSNRVYQWRLLLEEYAPEIVYIKGIHNTVADAVSWLEYNPEINPTNEQNFANLELPSKGHHWRGFAALWRSYNEKNPGTHGQDCNLNYVFANCSKEEEIYLLTAQEVADAQKVDASIKHCFKSNHVFDKDFDIRLVDKTSVVCKMAEWSSLSHCRGVRFCGSTTTCNTLDTLVLKKQCKVQCTGKVCKLPSGQ